jgi:hypothetical protein
MRDTQLSEEEKKRITVKKYTQHIPEVPQEIQSEYIGQLMEHAASSRPTGEEIYSRWNGDSNMLMT